MLALILPFLTMLLLSTALSAYLIWTPLAIALLVLSFIFLLSFPPSTPLMARPFFYYDPLAVSLIIITLWLTRLIILARQKIVLSKNNSSFFIFSLISLAFILFFAFSAKSLIIFYIFFEASLIPTLLLILTWGYQPERLQASIYLIIYTVTASLPLLLSIIIILKTAGHLDLSLFFWSFPVSNTLGAIWWLITLAAFLVKTPLFLTHLWLPKAHVEAPVAGSMVLAGVLLKLGSYGILRLASKFLLFNKLARDLVLAISLIGGVITGFICVRQTDVKALIAYSSVSHIGLATAGVISNTSWGWQGAFIILIAHGLCSSCMFSLANITYETISSRSIFITKGLINLFPSLTFWWFCFAACNMAAPPSINLGAEILLISRTISFSSFNSIPLSLIVFIAAAYSLFLYTSTQHGSSPHFQNPLSLLTPRNYTIAFAHFTPLLFIVLKRDLVIFWL